MQASKALSKNGSVLGGSLMVGVGPCKEASLSLSHCEGGGDTSLLNTSSLNTSAVTRAGGNNTPRTIRPLTQAYKEAHTEHKVGL